MPTAGPLRLVAAFDDVAWDQDLTRSSPEGVIAAGRARRRYEQDGIVAHELRPCEADARDGTTLPNCFKTYLPPPAGRFGMVFQFRRADRRAVLMYLAFGVRHQPRESPAPTVYQLADQRLNEPA